MKKYFIDAAKEILAAEGVENVSVRKIGEVTGYSYATIYNYFYNIEHLLYCTGIDFITDIMKIFEEDIKKKQYSIEDLKEMYKRYINYFITNPNIFKFFFFHNFNPPEEVTRTEPQRPSLGKVTTHVLSNLAEQKIIKKEDVSIVDDLITNAVHGLLTIYFSQKRALTTEILYNKTERMLEYLIINRKDKFTL